MLHSITDSYLSPRRRSLKPSTFFTSSVSSSEMSSILDSRNRYSLRSPCGQNRMPYLAPGLSVLVGFPVVGLAVVLLDMIGTCVVLSVQLAYDTVITASLVVNVRSKVILLNIFSVR